MLKIGSHINLEGKEMLLGASKKAVTYGCNCFMVYTGAPQNTLRKPMETFLIEESRIFLQEHNLKLEDIIVHAPYIINMASPFEDKRDFSVQFITEELRRTYQMGSKNFVIHPGSFIDNHEEGIQRVINCLNKIIANTSDLDVCILIETMCGKGTEIGRNFTELKQIIDQIVDKSRIGVCLDTCHIHDYGYDLNDFETVIDEFEQIVGLNYLKVLHINDSKNLLGAKKDRHENIGYGNIGFKNLLNVIYHPKLENLYKILETPFVDDKAPYQIEIEMIRKKEFYLFKENI